MTRGVSLSAVAQTFADELKELLKQTVCDGVHMGVVERPDGDVFIGTNMHRFGRAAPISLRTVGDVSCWLSIHLRTSLDASGYLMVEDSTFTISATDDQIELLHYDYERDKADYPDAHVQVNASSEAWDTLLLASGKQRGGLGKLHLPTGGRRYRPSVEDVLEMLIDEKVIDPKPRARQLLSASREKFQRRQLRAAIRRDPEAAVLELRDAGYEIREPDQVAAPVVPIGVAKGRSRSRSGKKGKRK